MNINIKKSIAAVCALSLLALSSGCSSKDHGLDPADPAEITIWHYYNGVQQDQFDNMVTEFNETVGHDMGITVEARSKSTIADLADNVLSSLRGDVGAEEPPDMFAAYSETAFTADSMGKVVDLTDYFTEEELSEYVSGYIEEGIFGEDKGLKIFPTAKSVEVMMLNLTDWQTFADSAGVTTDDLSTWEGLVDVAEKYYDYTDALTPDTPCDGKAFFGRDSLANYMIVGARQLGLEYFADNGSGEVVMNEDKDAVRRLWDCYYVPYAEGCFLARSRFRSDDTKIGAIIAMVCSTTGASYFPDSVTLDDEYIYPIEGMVLPVPNFEGTDPFCVQQGAGMVVLKSDEKTEYACSVFLKWLTEKERNIDFSVSSGYLPVKKEANDFAAISEDYLSGDGSQNDIMLRTLEVAISETSSFELYSAKPFERSAEVRDFIGEYMQSTAQTAHDEAYERIAAGEDRAAVLAEYTSDEAFEKWYEGFIGGLKDVSDIA